MLGGAEKETYLTEVEFMQNIMKKGITDGVSSKNKQLLSILAVPPKKCFLGLACFLPKFFHRLFQ